MENLNYYSFGNYANLRCIIIDAGVRIEDIVTTNLGQLMHIDPKTSQVIGYNSRSISFNHKVNIIHETKGIPGLMKKKIQVFMEIRNKFAHVKSIDSFNAYFQHSKNYNGTEKILKDWYENVGEKEKTFEDEYRHYFTLLVKEIDDYLTNEYLQNIVNTVSKKRLTENNDLLIKILKEDIKQSKEASNIFYNAVKKVSQERHKNKNE